MSHLATYAASSSGALTVTTALFTVPATATYCTVMCGMRGADGTATTLTSVLVGAQSATLNSGLYRRFDAFQAQEGGYILAADMPSGSITATATRGTATNGFTISVSFFDDAEQQAPIVALAGNSAGGDPFDTSISLTTAGVLVDGITTSNTGATFTTNQTGQTEQSHPSPTGSVNSYSSTRAVSSGLNDMGWDTGANGDRTSHVIFGIEEVTASVSVTPADATPNDGDVQTFTFSGATGPITAASIAGVDILSDLSGTDPSVPVTFTINVTSLATLELTGTTPRIGKDSTVSFTTTTDGAITTTVNMQPKTGWAVDDLAATLDKTANGYLALVDSTNGITTVIGNQNYYKQLYGESITAQGVYTGGTLLPYQFTEYVIQQGGSATTAATAYGEKFYPFGESAGGSTERKLTYSKLTGVKLTSSKLEASKL